MKNKSLTNVLLKVSVFCLLSNTLCALDDYDCYSKDQNIWFSGKTYEGSDNKEHFVSSVQVYLKGKKIKSIYEKEMLEGSDANKFEYYSKNLKVNLDWNKRFLEFCYKNKKEQVETKYTGELICE